MGDPAAAIATHLKPNGQVIVPTQSSNGCKSRGCVVSQRYLAHLCVFFLLIPISVGDCRESTVDHWESPADYCESAVDFRESAIECMCLVYLTGVLPMAWLHNIWETQRLP